MLPVMARRPATVLADSTSSAKGLRMYRRANPTSLPRGILKAVDVIGEELKEDLQKCRI